jgi:peptidoglycan hydrolase-like protein with peptidoglycan-binding domain
LVGLVVVVVAVLVVRTMRNDAKAARERTASVLPGERPEGARPERSAAEKKATPDKPRLSSVERAKIVLKEKGYYNGPINANYDQSVIDAVKRFQKDAGMDQNGYLNERTYTALGIEIRGKR